MMRRFAVLLVLVLMAAACSGESTPSAGGENGGDAPAGDETTIAGFMGWDVGSDVDWRDQEARMQEAVRVCMAKEGFDYKPVLPPDDAFTVREFNEAEEVAKRGFGITTWVTQQFEEQDPGTVWEDPNDETLANMSDSERQAWNDALYGSEEEQMENTTIEVDPETGEEIWMQEGWGPGCYGEASQEVYGDMAGGGGQDLWEQLQPAFEEMYARVQADARILELDKDWAACMTDKGHQVTTMNDFHMNVYEDFQQRLDAILGEDFWSGDPLEGMSEKEMEEFWNKPQSEIDAVFQEFERTRVDKIDRTALEALQQEEIALAVDEFECRGDYWEVYQEVSESYEAEFIEENRALLLQIRDAEQG